MFATLFSFVAFLFLNICTCGPPYFHPETQHSNLFCHRACEWRSKRSIDRLSISKWHLLTTRESERGVRVTGFMSVKTSCEAVMSRCIALWAVRSEGEGPTLKSRCKNSIAVDDLHSSTISGKKDKNINKCTDAVKLNSLLAAPLFKLLLLFFLFLLFFFCFFLFFTETIRKYSVSHYFQQFARCVAGVQIRFAGGFVEFIAWKIFPVVSTLIFFFCSSACSW